MNQVMNRMEIGAALPLMFLSIAFANPYPIRECAEPLNASRIIGEELKRIYPLLGSVSFPQEPPRTHNRQRHGNLQENDEGNRRFPGPHSCDEILNGFGTEIHELSICPWVIEMNVDEDRIPTTLAIARCHCAERCLLTSGYCAPVYGAYPVVERMCSEWSGEFSYRGKIEQIAVGCSCMH